MPVDCLLQLQRNPGEGIGFYETPSIRRNVDRIIGSHEKALETGGVYN